MPEQFLHPVPILLLITFLGSLSFLVGTFLKATYDCGKLVDDCHAILDDCHAILNDKS